MKTNTQMFNLIRKFIPGKSRKEIYRESLDIYLKYLEGELVPKSKGILLEAVKDTEGCKGCILENSDELCSDPVKMFKDQGLPDCDEGYIYKVKEIDNETC